MYLIDARAQLLSQCAQYLIYSQLFNHRLYPHHAKLQSIRWYKAGGRIVYQDAVDCLQDAEEVSDKLQSVCISPV